MIKVMMTAFSLLLGIVSWFLLTKANESFAIFNKSGTEKFFCLNGISYLFFAILSVISVFLDNDLFIITILVLSSLYTAVFSLRLAALLKK